MSGLFRTILEECGLESAVGFRCVLMGDGAVFVEGATALEAYAPEAVRIRCGKRRVEIEGEGLFLKELARGEMTVCGHILGLRLL